LKNVEMQEAGNYPDDADTEPDQRSNATQHEERPPESGARASLEFSFVSWNRHVQFL
jgi:hypothetical protein